MYLMLECRTVLPNDFVFPSNIRAKEHNKLRFSYLIGALSCNNFADNFNRNHVQNLIFDVEKALSGLSPLEFYTSCDKKVYKSSLYTHLSRYHIYLSETFPNKYPKKPDLVNEALGFWDRAKSLKIESLDKKECSLVSDAKGLIHKAVAIWYTKYHDPGSIKKCWNNEIVPAATKAISAFKKAQHAYAYRPNPFMGELDLLIELLGFLKEKIVPKHTPLRQFLESSNRDYDIFPDLKNSFTSCQRLISTIEVIITNPNCAQNYDIHYTKQKIGDQIATLWVLEGPGATKVTDWISAKKQLSLKLEKALKNKNEDWTKVALYLFRFWKYICKRNPSDRFKQPLSPEHVAYCFLAYSEIVAAEWKNDIYDNVPDFILLCSEMTRDAVKFLTKIESLQPFGERVWEFKNMRAILNGWIEKMTKSEHLDASVSQDALVMPHFYRMLLLLLHFFTGPSASMNHLILEFNVSFDYCKKWQGAHNGSTKFLLRQFSKMQNGGFIHPHPNNLFSALMSANTFNYLLFSKHEKESIEARRSIARDYLEVCGVLRKDHETQIISPQLPLQVKCKLYASDEQRHAEIYGRTLPCVLRFRIAGILAGIIDTESILPSKEEEFMNRFQYS